jgi:hypothetical protein
MFYGGMEYHKEENKMVKSLNNVFLVPIIVLVIVIFFYFLLKKKQIIQSHLKK